MRDMPGIFGGLAGGLKQTDTFIAAERQIPAVNYLQDKSKKENCRQNPGGF
jgi:hypothetical protein